MSDKASERVKILLALVDLFQKSGLDAVVDVYFRNGTIVSMNQTIKQTTKII